MSSKQIKSGKKTEMTQYKKDYMNITEKNASKYIKKYNLPSQKEYLINLYKTYNYLKYKKDN